jgi:S-formylglutathione hydrolase FrmB
MRFHTRVVFPIAALLLTASVAPLGVANVKGGNCLTYPQPATSTRLLRTKIEGVPVNVLLPPEYSTSGRRYPVLYLPNSGYSDEDDYLYSDLIAFTDSLPEEQQAIVVMPFGGPLDFYTDWRDGERAWETFDIETLIPAIDATYRTIADRAHRAIAGFSLGGLGAMGYAARHPELFVAAGSFSGVVDTTALSPAGEAALTAIFVTYLPCYGEVHPPFAPYGDPVTDDVWWHAHNPTDLAENLGGVSVYLATGNGIPGDRSNVNPTDPAGAAVVTLFEAGVHLMAQDFDAALTAAGVSHTSDFYGNGTHDYSYVSRDYRYFWPQMLAAFGGALPRSFDHRRVESEFSAYGWTFRADATRAAEFLDITDASCSGLTLTGSGTTTVTSARCFTPRRIVALNGAVERRVRADRSGRITFHVALGPAHQLQQYTAPQRALEAAGGYWTSRTVTFGGDNR